MYLKLYLSENIRELTVFRAVSWKTGRLASFTDSEKMTAIRTIWRWNVTI